jgi:hypothetical protein
MEFKMFSVPKLIALMLAVSGVAAAAQSGSSRVLVSTEVCRNETSQYKFDQDLFLEQTAYYAAITLELIACSGGQDGNSPNFECTGIEVPSSIVEDYRAACESKNGLLVQSEPTFVDCSDDLGNRVKLDFAGAYFCIYKDCEESNMKELVAEEMAFSPAGGFAFYETNAAAAGYTCRDKDDPATESDESSGTPAGWILAVSMNALFVVGVFL